MIRRRLDEVRREHDIVILHVIESGSRAWGFPSPDSGYDVRFLSNPASMKPAARFPISLPAAGSSSGTRELAG
ncbi:hypothetical protein D0B54_17415 [Solimonas sp. K1W22B-7]|nr:hypothetical protein D0B54_17415 [Solimonas sp. K1W22B-7]